MAKMTFRIQRDQLEDEFSVLAATHGHHAKFKRLVNNSDGWSVFVGFDSRGYPVCVQRAKDEAQIMVRAGCRYKSLRASMNHWGRRSRGFYGKDVLNLIGIGLRTARWCGYIQARYYPKKFDTKIRN